MSLFSFFALANASGPQGNQSTGLWACCSRYGLLSLPSRLAGRFSVGGAARAAPARSSRAAIRVGVCSMADSAEGHGDGPQSVGPWQILYGRGGDFRYTGRAAALILTLSVTRLG